MFNSNFQSSDVSFNHMADKLKAPSSLIGYEVKSCTECYLFRKFIKL